MGGLVGHHSTQPVAGIDIVYPVIEPPVRGSYIACRIGGFKNAAQIAVESEGVGVRRELSLSYRQAPAVEHKPVGRSDLRRKGHDGQRMPTIHAGSAFGCGKCLVRLYVVKKGILQNDSDGRCFALRPGAVGYPRHLVDPDGILISCGRNAVYLEVYPDAADVRHDDRTELFPFSAEGNFAFLAIRAERQPTSSDIVARSLVPEAEAATASWHIRLQGI